MSESVKYHISETSGFTHLVGSGNLPCHSQ